MWPHRSARGQLLERKLMLRLYTRLVHKIFFQEEFRYNADTQHVLAKNGEALLAAINFFTSGITTLCSKTMEDTLLTVKKYETARYVLSSISWYR